MRFKLRALSLRVSRADPVANMAALFASTKEILLHILPL